MAYQVKRLKKIQETLELTDDKGNVVESITTDLTVDDVAKDINKARNAIVRAQQNIKNTPIEKAENAQEQLGNAIISMFNLVFGDVQTKKILKFYEDNYTEMLICVFPFIQDTVFPTIETAIKDRKELMAENFKFTASQKRKIGI